MKNDKQDQKQQPQPRQEPIKVIRQGAIAASIWKRQTPTGFEYLDFSLSRSWRLKSGEKEGYSSNYFDRNEEALVQVVSDACEYIRSKQTILSTANGAATAGMEQVDSA